MTKHRKWIFLALALAALLAFCALPVKTSANVFQTQLDRAGIHVQIPPAGKPTL